MRRPGARIRRSEAAAAVVAGNVTNPMLLPPTTFLSNSDCLVLGTAQGPPGREDIDSQVRRYLTSGALDTTFSSPLFDFAPANVQTTSIGVALTTAFAGGGQAASVLVETDENILVLGTSAVSGGQQNLRLARHLGQ